MNRFNELPPHAEERPQDASRSMGQLICPHASRRRLPAFSGRGLESLMKPLLGDLPFRNSRRVYLAIKLAVLALAVLLALHFLWGVV